MPPGSSSPETCDVYWARTSWLRPGHLELLTDVERARRARYLHAADRDRFTVAAALLRIVVGLRTGVAPEAVHIDRTCSRCAEQHGRPTVVGYPLEVSVSHSGEFTVVAATGAGPVGVDVEHVRPIDHVALSRELGEPHDHHAGAGLDAFYVVWTRKESVLKAAGVGLEVPMAAILVTPPTEPPRLLRHWDEAPIAAQMADATPGDGYAGAVTVLTSAPITFREWDAMELLAAA